MILSLREENEDKTAVWLNDQPAGAKYQRPYLLSYEAETPEMVSYLLLIISMVVAAPLP